MASLCLHFSAVPRCQLIPYSSLHSEQMSQIRLGVTRKSQVSCFRFPLSIGGWRCVVTFSPSLFSLFYGQSKLQLSGSVQCCPSESLRSPLSSFILFMCHPAQSPFAPRVNAPFLAIPRVLTLPPASGCSCSVCAFLSCIFNLSHCISLYQKK